ncbi:hypothetical protein GCM10009555_083690 [Acrocarpospora macrocephala]|nr:hypothetical protein [Acrocarpospora macrocephala]
MNATSAAYRCTPPASDNDNPGRSVGNAPTISRHPDHTPTSSAALRSSRASPIASTAEPTASAVSATGSSQPCAAQAYSLIMSRNGFNPDTACRTAMAATPTEVIKNPNTIPMTSTVLGSVLHPHRRSAPPTPDSPLIPP